MRAIFGDGLGRRGGSGLLLQAVDSLDQEEYDQGYDNEVNNIIDEIAVGNFGAPQCEGQAGEIDPADDQADQGHDDVTDQRGNDLAEGSADDDRDRQVHDIASHDKFFEFFNHILLLSMCVVIVPSGMGAVNARRVLRAGARLLHLEWKVLAKARDQAAINPSFSAWEGSFGPNYEEQFGGNGEQEEKKPIYCRFWVLLRFS